jgi:hypothetical protein
VSSYVILNRTNDALPDVLSLYVHRSDSYPINSPYAHFKVISNQTLQKYPILLNAIANASKIKYGHFYAPKIDFVQGKIVTDLGLNSSSLSPNASRIYNKHD